MKLSAFKCGLGLAMAASMAAGAYAQGSYQLAYSYSDADGNASASPTSNVTVYVARAPESVEREIRGGTFRIFYDAAEVRTSAVSVGPGKDTSQFSPNLAGANDTNDLDAQPATTKFSLVTLIYSAGHPLRNVDGTLPVGWTPGTPAPGLWDRLVIWTFDTPADGSGRRAVPSALGIQGTSVANSGISDGAKGGDGGSATVPGGNVNGFSTQGGVLAVEMISIDAKATGNGVLVTWETGMEIDNAGFNVYSQPGVGGGFSRLNPILIGAAGTAASYSFLDSKALGNGETRLYFVEDVDVSGLATTLHGPAVVTGSGASNVEDWNMF